MLLLIIFAVFLILVVIINNADFEESYNKAIADKQKAQLAAEQQEIVNQQNIDKADADAKAAVTKASCDAEAKKIAAEAEAKANETLEKSITNNILKDKYIENGTVNYQRLYLMIVLCFSTLTLMKKRVNNDEK